LNLDCALLRAYAPAQSLYPLLLAYPQEIIPIMDLVINDVYAARFPPTQGEPLHAIQVCV
jgi:hypothetical protein